MLSRPLISFVLLTLSFAFPVLFIVSLPFTAHTISRIYTTTVGLRKARDTYLEESTIVAVGQFFGSKR